VVELLVQGGFDVGSPEVLPDNREQIIDALLAAVGAGHQLVVTTGGTGLGPRDLTPQATADVVDYEVPGLGEHMRRVGMETTPMAVLSRGLAGVRDRTLILNLPGSQAGAVQSLEAVLPVLGHAMQLLQGQTEHV
jgi:molybdenum cofactor biosynthesis protein B